MNINWNILNAIAMCSIILRVFLLGMFLFSIIFFTYFFLSLKPKSGFWSLSIEFDWENSKNLLQGII